MSGCYLKCKSSQLVKVNEDIPTGLHSFNTCIWRGITIPGCRRHLEVQVKLHLKSFHLYWFSRVSSLFPFPSIQNLSLKASMGSWCVKSPTTTWIISRVTCGYQIHRQHEPLPAPPVSISLSKQPSKTNSNRLAGLSDSTRGIIGAVID